MALSDLMPPAVCGVVGMWRGADNPTGTTISQMLLNDDDEGPQPQGGTRRWAWLVLMTLNL